ncbi:MAG: hypothetical protein LQ351_004010 [Letrouitia transgressa]|nr:MAG: hypothetical protein LQ351_004010 [Letrouitia transgressa]
MSIFIPTLRVHPTLTQLIPCLSVDGLGYLKILAPPEKILRWVEKKLNLLGRLPHYVSIDQKIYGRYGVLPTSNSSMPATGEGSVQMNYLNTAQRLDP